MCRRWHRDDITTCCHELKIEKYALKNTPRMSMFILGIFSWRRPTPCMHAGRRRRCAGRRPRDAGRRRPAHGVDAGNVHVYFNGGGYTWSVMQAACRLHAGRRRQENTPRIELATCMQAACMLLQPATSCIRSYAGCMQPACSLHASLVWHWLKRKLDHHLMNVRGIFKHLLFPLLKTIHRNPVCAVVV